MTKPDGGPAFPAMRLGGTYCTPGMSLRDWFAGQALAGMLAREDFRQDVAAKEAFEIADEMLIQSDESGGEE